MPTVYHIVLSLQQKRNKEQHGYIYKKSLNNHINITFKFKESPLSFTESTKKSKACLKRAQLIKMISVQNYRKLLKSPNVLHHFSQNISSPIYYVKMIRQHQVKEFCALAALDFILKNYIGEIVEFRTFCVKFPILQADSSENIWRLQIKSVSLQH